MKKMGSGSASSWLSSRCPTPRSANRSASHHAVPQPDQVKRVLAAAALIMLVVAFPAFAQDDGDILYRDWGTEGGGGGGYGCWNCVPEGNWNLSCGGGPSSECRQVGDEQHGEATWCTTIEWWSGCFYCNMSGGPCFNVEIHG